MGVSSDKVLDTARRSNKPKSPSKAKKVSEGKYIFDTFFIGKEEGADAISSRGLPCKRMVAFKKKKKTTTGKKRGLAVSSQKVT